MAPKIGASRKEQVPVSDEKRLVASGTWFYDKTVPKPISIYAVPARLSGSRYDDDDQLDESTPIPNTVDGFVYRCSLGGGGEHATVDEARAWADSQPWGPVTWK